MSNHRHLTVQEIQDLRANSCWAEDWDRVLVTDSF